MPGEKGRTGKPGNDTTYRNIGIHTANPSAIQPGRKRGNLSIGEVFKHKSDGKKSNGGSKSEKY